MSFHKLQWRFPIAVTLHNSKEAIWHPAWWVRHAEEVPVHPGARSISIRCRCADRGRKTYSPPQTTPATQGSLILYYNAARAQTPHPWLGSLA